MNKVKAFLKRKDIEISARRYGIDALGAMAQGLFCSLLIGTIINTVGQQFGIDYLVTIGGYATAMSGPAMAVAIGYALRCPPLVLFSLVAVGSAANGLGGAGGPLAVLVIAIVAAECGKAVSKETKIDILVTPAVTIFVGVALSTLIAPPIGTAASWVGQLIMWATELQPFLMGVVVSVLVGVALTLPISSAAICAALGLTGPLATCVFHLEMNGAPVSSGMGTCGLVGQIGVYTGWVSDVAAGTKAAITAFDWIGLVLICFILPGVLTWLFGLAERRLGWIREGDLKLN